MPDDVAKALKSAGLRRVLRRAGAQRPAVRYSAKSGS
jgi:hypothetical protein